MGITIPFQSKFIRLPLGPTLGIESFIFFSARSERRFCVQNMSWRANGWFPWVVNKGNDMFFRLGDGFLGKILGWALYFGALWFKIAGNK